MNKKVLKLARLLGLLLLVVLVVLGVRKYLQNSKENIQQVSEQKITLDKDIPLSLKLNAHAIQEKKNNEEVNSKSYIEEDDNFEEFDQAEQVWGAKVKEILGDKNFIIYEEMKKLNDEEKMLAYKEYHDYLRQKYGAHFSYNISEDQSLREKQINQRYLQKLLKMVGPEVFKKYTEAKDLFNESMRRRNKESIQVEF